MGILLIGSVHTLYRNVPGVIDEIERFSPGYIAIELIDRNQESTSHEIENIRRMYYPKIFGIDRPIDITVKRYLGGTDPGVFLREEIMRYACLPLNIASSLSYDHLHGLYNRLFPGRFYTFGWSEDDTRRYIYERDEYMAGKFIDLMRSLKDSGITHERYVILTGRRHIPGILCILEAYRYTNDVGSYYAGGKVLDVFSLKELEDPLPLAYDKSRDNYIKNRFIKSILSSLFLPAYSLLFFIIALAILLAVIAGIYSAISALI
ncbi:hypothetical protein CUJ83_08950 [Methanocella sp. CWC-04]|uniref:Uncharacterized protein n=2 Tax=Methanooceanicella nereidis TaxID=2052831 RepID=A0AAP2W7E6_9EURY|nr:hypothetical protein [Methanocella sp. CWC-04]